MRRAAGLQGRPGRAAPACRSVLNVPDTSTPDQVTCKALLIRVIHWHQAFQEVNETYQQCTGMLSAKLDPTEAVWQIKILHAPHQR